jgi:dephospho-CoA kinase
MLRIGITGGIGSGKSTVCRILESLDVPVYYADVRSKYLLEHDHEVREKVHEEFGPGVFTAGRLNRKALAAIVFQDEARLRKLEGITHPAVRKDFERWFSRQHADYIVKEAALLFEAGTYKELDKTILVSSPMELRLARVSNRDSVKPEEIQARIDMQWPEEKKKALADYILYNDETQLLLPQIIRLHEFFSGLAQA